ERQTFLQIRLRSLQIARHQRHFGQVRYEQRTADEAAGRANRIERAAERDDVSLDGFAHRVAAGVVEIGQEPDLLHFLLGATSGEGRTVALERVQIAQHYLGPGDGAKGGRRHGGRVLVIANFRPDLLAEARSAVELSEREPYQDLEAQN